MPSTLEAIILGFLVLLLLISFRPSMLAAVAHSRTVPPRWRDLALPIGAVIAFVLLLISLT